jgi:hypothetical protein
MNARELRIQLEQYLSARSALGIKDRGRKTLLQDFLRYLVKMKYGGSITCRLAVDWATTTPKARATGLAGPSRRLIAARGFLSHVGASSDDVEVPAARLLAAAKGRRPYLYSAEQIADLFQAALALGPKGSLRPHARSATLLCHRATNFMVPPGSVHSRSCPAALGLSGSRKTSTKLLVFHRDARAATRCGGVVPTLCECGWGSKSA